MSSTVAQTTTNGRITDLATYSDFGIPTFTSTGYASPTGYTGELTDATTGQNSYFSRTYDPFTATWLTADSYRGTLSNPASQHRYGYVENNPTTFVDAYGFRLSDPGAYAPLTKTRASTRQQTIANTTCIRNSCVNTPSHHNDTSDRHPAICANPGPRGTCMAEPSLQEKVTSQAIDSPIRIAFSLIWRSLDPVRQSSWQVYRAIVNAFPSTVGLVSGLVNRADCQLTLATGITVCYGATGGFFGGGTMFGNTFVTGYSKQQLEVNPDLSGVIEHETKHADQWATMTAIPFVLNYEVQRQTSLSTTGTTGCNNWFEIDADLENGTYEC